jgi:hypothetical protein
MIGPRKLKESGGMEERTLYRIRPFWREDIGVAAMFMCVATHAMQEGEVRCAAFL